MGRRLAVAACVLATASLTACGDTATQGHRGGFAQPEATPTPSQRPGWTATAITNAPSGVAISHPIVWRFVKSDAVYLGGSSVLGHFTNAPTQTQCHTTNFKGGEKIDCDGPVARLTASQVLITVSAQYLFVSEGTVKTNVVIDGRPAKISTISDPQGACPPGAGGAQDLYVDLNRAAPANPQSHWHLFITACEGNMGGMPNSEGPLGDVEKVLRGITFPLVVR